MESRKPRFGENNRQAPTWANTKGGGLGGNAPGEAQAKSTRGGSGGERPRRGASRVCQGGNDQWSTHVDDHVKDIGHLQHLCEWTFNAFAL